MRHAPALRVHPAAAAALGLLAGVLLAGGWPRGARSGGESECDCAELGHLRRENAALRQALGRRPGRQLLSSSSGVQEWPVPKTTQASRQREQQDVAQAMPAAAAATLDLDMEDAKGIFKVLDANADGKLSSQEFMDACMQLQGFAGTGALAGSGVAPLTGKVAKAIPAAASATSKLSLDDAWELFRILDGDSDGAVSQKEFLAGCVRLRGFVDAASAARAAVAGEAGHGEKHTGATTLAKIASVVGLYRMLAVLTVALAVFFEFLRVRCSGIDFSAPIQGLDGAHDSMESLPRMDYQGLWSLLATYWTSKDSLGAWWRFGLVLALEALGIWISKEIANLTSMYWNCIQYKEFGAFVAVVQASMCFFLFAIVSGSYNGYARGMLSIHWRTALTTRLQQLWLRKRAFYKMRIMEASGAGMSIDNPDQRIESDADEFVRSSLDLFFGIFGSVGRLVVFLPMLWSLSPEHVFGIEGLRVPGWICWITLVYAVSGSAALHIVGRRLIYINYANQRIEADFRSGLIRVRDGAEAIAIFGAEGLEEGRLARLFSAVQRIFWESMRTNLKIGIFKSFYFFTSEFFPLFALSPSYFAGHITLGMLNQAKFALSTVLGSLSWFLEAYESVMSFRATCTRLTEFIQVAQECGEGAAGSALGKDGGSGFEGLRLMDEPGGGIAFNGLVCLPGGKPLFDHVSLAVPGGSWAMISGPSGCGKTTLLRAMVGLWPFGSGQSRRPADTSMVPAEASVRLIRSATLREVVSYPQPLGTFSDAEIEAALRDVDLGVLLEADLPDVEMMSPSPAKAAVAPLIESREKRTPCGCKLGGEAGYEAVQPLAAAAAGPLDRRDDWALALSSGQRQRLEFAYLLCARPALVVLDEPTAHLPTEAASLLLRVLRRALPPAASVVTVSHDAGLAGLHDIQFAMGAGRLTCSMDPSPESSPEESAPI